MQRIMANPEIEAELSFPLDGVDLTRSYQRQRPGTCVDALNMRAFDPLTGRARGGSRSGISKVLATQPVGDYPIQDLNYIVTDVPPPAVPSAIGQFIYSLASGSGFGLGNGITGANIATGGVASGFAMSCSCWDTLGNAYVAMVNTTTGAVNIIKISLTGTVAWTLTTLTVTTGSLRLLAGIAVAGDFLFVARVLAGSSYIDKISLAGAIVSLGWKTYSAQIAFSTNSVNCMASIGTTLGVEIGASASPAFALFNSANATGTVIGGANYTGTFANAFSCVTSDGVGYFYTIASITTNQIRQINLAGTQVWANALAGAAVAHGLCFDNQNNMLVAVGTGGTYGVQSLSLTNGSTLLGNSSLGTTWDSVGSNGAGTFILQKNAVASNDIVAVNTSFAAVWGPSTYANTTHYGSSVNKTAISVSSGLSSRVVTWLGCSNGEIFTFTDTVKNTLTGGAAALSIVAPVVFSAQNGTKMFYCDGQNYKWYDGTTGQVAAWTLTAGSFPRDSLNNGCRLIEVWNGRIVLSGLPLDSQNWFMSKVSDPRDFNTGVTPATQTMAVFGNLSPLGLLGAPVQCMIPYVDNTMIFGLSHEIWLLQGDPQAGGSFVLVTDKLGMPFGRPWCKDPNGQVFFLSSRDGVFKITPGALPVRVSQQIEQLIEGIELGTSIIRMEWDTQAQGFGLWITPLAGGATTNFFWEERTNAWWPDAYASTGHNPHCVKAFDGDSPDDRRIFLGCRDGYIRAITPTATLDDHLPIASFVYLGPIGTRELDDVMLKAIHARLAEESEPVTFSVYVGKSAEAAFSSEPVMSGTWTAGHNPTTYIRWAGVAVYVRIDCSGPWAAEAIRMTYQRTGLVRRRA